MILPALLALCAPASAASLDKIRAWPVYDERASRPIDFGDLCRMARLPCGLVAPAGQALAAPEGPVAGQTVGALLERILAAHPGYAAELRDGVLTVRRAKDGCASSLERKAAKGRRAPASARVAALLVLRASGWPKPADAALASLAGDEEDARFLRVEVMIHEGATVRGSLDAIARGDGRMLWHAESKGKACSGFRFRGWRAPQPLDGPSVLVSVTKP